MIQFLITALIAETFLLLFVAWLAYRAYKKGFVKPIAPVTTASNVAEGFWPGNKTFLSDVTLASRYLLVKFGSDANHITLAGAADKPLGVATDEVIAVNDPVDIDFFGSAHETKLMQASGVITVGDFLMPAANGQVATMSVSAGTYYCVGRALNSTTTAGDFVQVDPMPCVKWVV